MKIYIIKITVNDYRKSMYIDSVWENLQDAEKHIEECQNKGIFNEDFKAEIQIEKLYKHI